jgi:serine/threonine protein kinase
MPAPLKTREVLRGRYQVQRIIGQGGMGSIYLADDLRLEGRQCALKEVEHDRSLTSELLREARDQFLREATILARLDHPNLPKVSDFFSIVNHDYLVMDYIPGKDLRAIIQEARQSGNFISEEDVLNWANQLASALAYLHDQDPQIVHRDIKPSNLKLTPGGLLKLVDFGLVKLLAPGEVTITIIQGQGTVLYTPLEQYGGDTGHTDVRSDIYAFAATLYHLLTNQPPVAAKERFLNPEIMPSPRQVNSSISPRFERAILAGMSLHPDERPENVGAFRRMIFGNDIPTHTPPGVQKINLGSIFRSGPELSILWGTIGLTLLSLLVTLLQ